MQRTPITQQQHAVVTNEEPVMTVFKRFPQFHDQPCLFISKAMTFYESSVFHHRKKQTVTPKV